MPAYQIKQTNAVGLDVEAAELLRITAKALGLSRQALASAIITDVLTDRIRIGIHGTEED